MVFITDVVPVGTANEVVRLGFPSDMAGNLAGYYLLNDDGQISVSVSDDILWLEASPSTRWSGQTVSLVTVWQKVLVETRQGRYLISMPANPIRQSITPELLVLVTIDGTGSISSVSGVGLQISSDKRSANGTITEIPRGQFNTLNVFFESPDLLRYIIEEANVLVDIETKTVTADLLIANLGDAGFSSVDLKLGRTASVVSARSGIVNLKTSWDAENGVLNLELLQELERNQRTKFQVVYVSEEVFRRSGETVEVFPPNYLNATVSTYYLTVRTPPVSSISYNTEPWELKTTDENRRQITFRFTDVYITGREKLVLTYSEAPNIPIPLIILGFVAFLAGFLVVRSTKTAKEKTEIPGLKQFRKSVESAAENLIQEIERIGTDEKQKRTFKNVEELLRPFKFALSELRKELKTPEAMQVYSSVEEAVNELSSTIQALNRLAEDYQSNRISKAVYRRIYSDYSRECRKILDRLMNVLDRAILQ